MTYFTYIDPNHVSLFDHCFNCDKKPSIIYSYSNVCDLIEIFALCKVHEQHYDNVIQPRLFIKKFLLDKEIKVILAIKPESNLTLNRDQIEKIIIDLKTSIE